MINYLHDIKNKLSIISCHTTILCGKYGEEDFIPIRTNLARISEIINESYLFLKNGPDNELQSHSPKEFNLQTDLLISAVEPLFQLTIRNEISEYRPEKNDFEINFNTNLFFQILENSLDNSLKASATKVIVRMLELDNNCILEIVDNGKDNNNVAIISDTQSIMPHGFGKSIINKNMSLMNGKAEWKPRLDQNGMIVRLYFPKKLIVI